ncbi:PepSY domain-containing protein [Achromobacter denitrificans]|uniref:PepSY-associated TM helix domain-containing protein n=1 Tax=Achromobacter denitrificans TaxID=32002 RepID=UPI00240DF876|nr:PepSY-associated TM helix domain-containing protein [Achromobacter denitrificans]MBV2159729.1 PepSY domain-containing protein [Achromobacter denitrificans]MDX3882112.1 PepSY-associated TM helix domain-containing protein [Achromobacter sp.]WFC66883.1 PepSY domain-containing protein [Achromobacter denitrificans]
MKAGKAKAQGEEGLRQSMSWLHTWAGLIFGWVLFAMFLTGTLAFFRPEITSWMQPEIQARPTPAVQAVDLAQRYLTEHAPDAKRWFITPPSNREPLIQMLYQVPKPKPGERGFVRVKLDPVSGQAVAGRETRGGDFFYRFHFELETAFPWGRWLASIAGMFMLVAIISGIITHKKIFTDFFTFRPKKGGQRAWMDGHNVLSVLGLPFHLMITFSGLVLFMVMLMPAGIQAVYENPRQYTDEVFKSFKITSPLNQPATLVPIAPLVAQAQDHWHGRVGRVTVNNPGDAGATVTLVRDAADGVSYGRLAPYMRFDGVTGALQEGEDDLSATVQTAGVITGLHLGLFAEPLLRWFYFLVSLAGTGMVGTGLVLWIAKRRQKARPGDVREAFSLRLVDGLNAGTIAGVVFGVAAFFLANRLLPAEMPGRQVWEVRAFFSAWGLSLVYAFLFQRRKWQDLLAIAAASLALVPVVNAFTTSRHLGVSLPAGDWVMAGFDLTCLASAALFGWMARKAARARKAPAKARAERPAAKAVSPKVAQAPAAQAASSHVVYEPRGDTP